MLLQKPAYLPWKFSTQTQKKYPIRELRDNFLFFCNGIIKIVFSYFTHTKIIKTTLKTARTKFQITRAFFCKSPIFYCASILSQFSFGSKKTPKTMCVDMVSLRQKSLAFFSPPLVGELNLEKKHAARNGITKILLLRVGTAIGGMVWSGKTFPRSSWNWTKNIFFYWTHIFLINGEYTPLKFSFAFPPFFAFPAVFVVRIRRKPGGSKSLMEGSLQWTHPLCQGQCLVHIFIGNFSGGGGKKK